MRQQRQVIRASVARLYPNTLAAIQAQVLLLGDTLHERELAEYIRGDGPASGYAPDGGAKNPNRPKAWHLGRVKHFYEQFKVGASVEPITIGHSRLLHDPWHVHDGAHRLLGAFFAGIPEIDALIGD